MDEKIVRFFLLLAFAFIAELIDGGIGMGYGVSLTSFLLSYGIGTAVASAAVHFSEVFTTLASGVSHFRAGNFDRKIFLWLAVPGVVGGALGAVAAVRLQNAAIVRPLVSGILLVLGVLIVVKFARKKDFLEAEYKTPRLRHLIPLGFVAAFVDAIGGGGWGPISTPALVMGNAAPDKAIGSVNFAEFFVTLSISVAFFLALPKTDLGIILPMIAGGIVAAPVAAAITKRLPHRILGIFVGCLVAALSLRTILLAVY